MDRTLFHLVLALGLTGFTVFLLGIFVYINKKNSPIGKIFFFYCFFISWWSIFEAFLLTSQDHRAALIFGRVMMAGDWFIPTLFVHFVISLLDLKPSKWYFLTIYSTSATLSLLSFSGFLIPDAVPGIFSKHMIKPGVLFPLGLLYFSACVIWSFIQLGGAWSRAEGSRREQYGILFWSSMLGYVGGCANFLLVFNISIPLLLPFGTYAVPLYVGATVYAIVRYRFLDIATVIHKTAMWLVVSSVVLIPVEAVSYLVYPWIRNLRPTEAMFIVGIIALLLIPYVKLIQPGIDHIFHRRKHDLQAILQNFIHEISALKGLKELLDKLEGTISTVLYPNRISVILFDMKSDDFVPLKIVKFDKEFSSENYASFLRRLEQKNSIVERDSINSDPLFTGVDNDALRYFQAVQAEVIIPLMHDRRLLGILNLGQKKNLGSYSKVELHFLANMKIEASIAFSNSLLYDDVNKMSEELRVWAFELENKVENRTKELSESKAELERSYEKLQELDRLKSQFFANISHELRTPLTLILAPLESYLQQPNLTGDQGRDFEIMYQNGLRLLKQINSLLDLAKIDAGKMQLNYAKTDLVTFSKGIVASVSRMAEKKRIALSFSCIEKSIDFYFDWDKIERVLLNLIFNAVKFTEAGGKIRVFCEQKGEEVLIKVEDTGIGIASENISKLFNRFSQVDSSASRRYEGTGIGLALAKEMVELHGGRIWAESEPGRGTAMTFSLPFLVEPQWPEGEEKPMPSDEDWARSIRRSAEYSLSGVLHEDSSTSESALAPGPKEGKILLIEDNPDMLRFIVSQLQDKHQVISARNGIEGVRRAKEDLPDLILSDIMMPLKDGYQVCREVKEDPTTKHIPVILVSAKADISMKIEGLEYGADDYLTKPFSSEELRARVKSLLNLRSLEREIQTRNAELQIALLELKSTQDQLVHSEKMAALGLLVAGLAHEINNPVAFAKGSLSTLRRAMEELEARLIERGVALNDDDTKDLVDDVRMSLSIIRTGLERTESIVSDLKAFVRKDEVFFKPTDIHQGIDSTLNLLRPELGERIKIIREYGEVGLVEAIPGRLNQVFMNLLHNAIHAIPENGEIRIRTWKECRTRDGGDRNEAKSEDWIRISIKDSGVGIPAANLKRIFEPFFTTKEVGKGTGLGLSVSYRIIENHNGEIQIKSEPGQGTEVILGLPIHRQESLLPAVVHSSFGG